MPNKTILFDLDGTLFDSGPDFEYIINKMRAKCGLGKLNYAEFRKIISAGSAAMVKHGLEINESDTNFNLLLKSFRNYYLRLMGERAVLFPGMQALLNELEQRKIVWGIVTNRMEKYIAPMLLRYGLQDRPACIVGADTTAHRKPHPAPLQHAAKLLGCATEDCYYIGDHMNDIIAAKAASMPSIAVSWGYHPSLAELQKLDPDFIVNTADEILSIIIE